MLPGELDLSPPWVSGTLKMESNTMAEHQPSITLAEHEEMSEHRAHKIKRAVKDLGHKINIFKEGSDGMDSVAAILPAIMAAQKDGSGSAVGAGALGFVAGAVLGGRGGLLGGAGAVADGGCVTPTQLTTALSGVTDTLQNSALLTAIGNTTSAVQLAESQTQLALAGAMSELTSVNTTNQAANAAGQAAINKNISEAIASALTGQNNINQNVSAQATLNLIATKEAQFANQLAVSNSTKEILAALNDQNMANLQRQLTVAESALAESRSASREHVNTLTITNTNTNTATAIAAQQQSQAQLQAILQLAAQVQNCHAEVQSVRQGQVTFNSGTMTGAGNQTAANTKVA